MSEDEKIDRHLRDRFKDQEHPVSDRVWENIKSSLPPENSDRGAWGWKNWLTTSAIVATTMALIYYWNTNQEPSNVISSGSTSASTAQIYSSENPSADKTQITPEIASANKPEYSVTTEKNTSNTTPVIFPQKPGRIFSNKNTSEKNVVSRNNPADKYSIAYAYTSHQAEVNNSSSPLVSENTVVVDGTNYAPNQRANKENSETTNAIPVTNGNSNPEDLTETSGDSENIAGNNTITQETTPGSDNTETDNPDNNFPVVMNTTPAASVKDQEPSGKEEKEKEKEKEEKLDEKNNKEEKDKDQEKEKSILPKPVFSADAYIMPAYTGVTTSSNTNDPSLVNQINHKNQHDRTWVTWSYGGRFNYHMTDAVEFSAGLHYQKIEERISATRSIDTITDGISAQSRYTMISIPLGAAYNFNAGKMRLRLGASCNLQYTLTSETYFFNDQKKDLEVYAYDAEGMNLSLQISGAMIYPITQHFHFLMEPTLQYNLDDLNHSTMFFKEKPYLIGLKTGVRVTF